MLNGTLSAEFAKIYIVVEFVKIYVVAEFVKYYIVCWTC